LLSPDVATLNVLALDDSGKLGVDVANLDSRCGLVALTKSLEVGGCFGSDVVEELDKHLLRSISVVDVELDVRSANSLVDGVLVGVVGLLLVDEVGRVVDVSKLLQSPLQEVLSVSQVSIFVG